MIQETEIFFNTNDFAEAAVLTPDGGAAVNCAVLFNNANAPIQTGDVTIINDNPTAEIQSSVIGATKKGTLKITRTNVTWYIIDVGPDIDGTVLLTLSRKTKS